MASPWTVIRKLLGSWPRAVEDFHERSNAYAEAGQYDAALEDLGQALRISAKNSGGELDGADAFYFLFCRGDLYRSMNEYDKARADYEEAVETYGDDFGTLDEERAECLIELGEFESAHKIFDSGDYANPDLHVQLIRARCLAGLGRVEEAEEAFQQSFEQAEESYGSPDEEALFHRGKFLLEQRRFDEGLVALREALQLHGESDHDLAPPVPSWVIDAYRLISQAERAEGNHESAREAAARADRLQEAEAKNRASGPHHVQRRIWFSAATEVAATMVGVSIFLWIGGPTVYEGLRMVLPLPPLPAWWRVVPGSLLGLFVVSLIVLAVANRMNDRQQRADSRSV